MVSADHHVHKFQKDFFYVKVILDGSVVQLNVYCFVLNFSQIKDRIKFKQGVFLTTNSNVLLDTVDVIQIRTDNQSGRGIFEK